jgi:Tub family
MAVVNMLIEQQAPAHSCVILTLRLLVTYKFLTYPKCDTIQRQVAAYVLNFNGRVTMASVKNFQLVTPEHQDSVVLQFGRVAKDEFTMDFQWPMSPFQVYT